MICEPYYSVGVEIILKRLEQGSDTRLLNAVCDAIDLVCVHGDSAKARAEILITNGGKLIWKIQVRDRRYGWCALWGLARSWW